VPRSLLRSAALSFTALTLAVTGAVTAAVTASSASAVPTVKTPVLSKRLGERTEFRISSFNVLGASHTRSGGRHARMASGAYRIRLAVRFLDREGIDVAGLQEFQMPQFEEFVRVAGDRFGVWPGGVSRRTVQNSIVWRLDQFTFVTGHTVQIPYHDGVLWDMPVVLLRHNVTGQLAYFANFHNPATNRRHRDGDVWREIATGIETSLVKTLAKETRLPVFVTGDMNAREDYFCRMVSEAPMRAANGGSYKHGVCTPPPRPMPVNWIFGVKRRGKFSDYVRDDSRLVNRITDHFVVHADVSIGPYWQTIPSPFSVVGSEPVPAPTY
jgi:hypothetical protein